MRIPTLRRRFVWPADDIVSMRPAADRLLDRALARLMTTEPEAVIHRHRPAPSIAVIGFPRSANTLLAQWLTMAARPGVSVIGGRLSHSVLDLHRLVDAGIPVVVPVRAPVDACASVMVRKDLQDSPSYALEILRSYSAWHRVARRLLDRDGVIVAGFSMITTNPLLLADHPALAALVDDDTAARLGMDDLVSRTRESLSDVVGQGLPENGIPAHQMISVPDAARAAELDRARALLTGDGLAGARRDAELQYEEFLSGTERAGSGRVAALGAATGAGAGSETTR